MLSDSLTLRVGALAGALAVVCLIVMILIGLQIGADLEHLSTWTVIAPSRVTELFVTSQGKLRTMMVVDDVFTLAYVIAFLALGTYARRRAPLFATIGLGLALGTGICDWLENSITLGLIAYTLPNVTRLSSEALLVLHIVTQVKFLCVSGAVTLLGIGLWDTRGLNRLTALLFWLFALLNILALISAPLANVRILGMLVLLALGTAVLWRDWRLTDC